MFRSWIILRDTNGEIVARFDRWIRFEVNHKINAPDNGILKLNANDRRILLFGTDYIIEYWRENKDNNIAAYREAELLHREPDYEYDDDGQLLFTSRSVGFEDLLRRRVIYNESDTARADKSAAAETVMKEYVDEQAGPNATTADGRIVSGVMTGLQIEADGARGDTWTGKKAMTNLMSTIKEIAKSKQMAYKIEGLDLSSPTFIFRAYPEPYGQDRRNVGVVASTGRNSAGNYPVIFADNFGTIQAPRLAESRMDEYNAIIVLGANNLRETTNPSITDSPWNRSEKAVSATSETEDDALDDIGAETVRDTKPQTIINGQIIQHPSLLYGRDYFLGDYITCRVSGIEANQVIKSVRITVNGTSGGFAEKIDPELEQI